MRHTTASHTLAALLWLALPLAATATATAQMAGMAGPAACREPSDADWRDTVLRRLNQLRQSGAQCGQRGAFGPAPALRWAPRLADLAVAQARHLAHTGELSHHNGQGEGLAQRMRQGGYAFTLAAENLASGWNEAQEALADWAGSDAHCANLMNPRLREVALACVPDAQRWNWWVLTLGTPMPAKP